MDTRSRVQLRTILLSVLGATEALLLARLTVQLFAARPDNSAFALLLAATAPLRAPLAMLDAGQPRFGSVLEFSTLALCAAIGLVLVLAMITRNRNFK